MRTWLSYAPPVTVNVNYSCLEALSTTLWGVCGALRVPGVVKVQREAPGVVALSKTLNFL